MWRSGIEVPYALLGATGPETMKKHAREFGAATCRLIYDPAFQIILLSAEDLIAGIDGAWAFIANDYEYAMLERKTGFRVDESPSAVELTVVTYGEQGSELRQAGTVAKCRPRQPPV